MNTWPHSQLSDPDRTNYKVCAISNVVGVVIVERGHKTVAKIHPYVVHCVHLKNMTHTNYDLSTKSALH